VHCSSLQIKSPADASDARDSKPCNRNILPAITARIDDYELMFAKALRLATRREFGKFRRLRISI
jgi:hypothetical protein